MTTITLIDIIENRIKSCNGNKTEEQLLVAIVEKLKKLQEYESGEGADE